MTSLLITCDVTVQLAVTYNSVVSIFFAVPSIVLQYAAANLVIICSSNCGCKKKKKKKKKKITRNLRTFNRREVGPELIDSTLKADMAVRTLRNTLYSKTVTLII